MALLDLPERQSPRLAGHDYTTEKIYSVTFCTAHRDPILSRIVDEQVVLLPAGHLLAHAWHVVLGDTSTMRLLAEKTMPDHVHALVALDYPKSPSLSTLIGTVKRTAAVAINRARRTPGAPVWQRSFHDHIIRDDIDLATHYRYIAENPRRWRSLPA